MQVLHFYARLLHFYAGYYISSFYYISMPYTTSKMKEEKSMPRQSLLSAENENKNDKNRILHWIFYLFTLNERSIFLGLINVIRKRSDS